VQPESRRNEVRRMVEDIKDISVSRSLLGWGIPWPGDADHTVYVWIDALTNYLSAIGFPDSEYRAHWPAALHVIGKDIIRFHCVYWPAMLLSADLPLPERVWAHGFMNMRGGKISKSNGVAFDLNEVFERHGADALRYFLLREIPWDGDGNFSLERFDERYTAELANDLGNLASRTITMVQKYRGGRVPAAGRGYLDEQTDLCVGEYLERMDSYLLHEGLGVVFGLVAEANGFVADLDAALRSLIRALAVTAVLLFPFMPEKMSELWSRLGAGEAAMPLLDDVVALEPAGRQVQAGGVLFPRPELSGV
jgi:methionyl-tRNA synthetase